MNVENSDMNPIEQTSAIELFDRRDEQRVPLFSVVIALYNAEEYFAATIDSLCANADRKSVV